MAESSIPIGPSQSAYKFGAAMSGGRVPWCLGAFLECPPILGTHVHFLDIGCPGIYARFLDVDVSDVCV